MSIEYGFITSSPGSDGRALDCFTYAHARSANLLPARTTGNNVTPFVDCQTPHATARGKGALSFISFFLYCNTMVL